MWTLVEYAPVALFSLKAASATSSGGKTLLTPTAFSIKMALLDAVIRTQGREVGQIAWPTIRDLRVAIALPQQIVVINTFTKIVRPKKNGPSEDRGTGLITPFGSTIAYREYVQYSGSLRLALQPAQNAAFEAGLNGALSQITYFGKRGGFVQLVEPPRETEALSDNGTWTTLTEDQTAFTLNGTLQLLDDCAASLSFSRADIYSGERITLGKERVLRHIVLPYQLKRSSRGFSLYERIT
jgi:hypothetical protein